MDCCLRGRYQHTAWRPAVHCARCARVKGPDTATVVTQLPAINSDNASACISCTIQNILEWTISSDGLAFLRYLWTVFALVWAAAALWNWLAPLIRRGPMPSYLKPLLHPWIAIFVLTISFAIYFRDLASALADAAVLKGYLYLPFTFAILISLRFISLPPLNAVWLTPLLLWVFGIIALFVALWLLVMLTEAFYAHHYKLACTDACWAEIWPKWTADFLAMTKPDFIANATIILLVGIGYALFAHLFNQLQGHAIGDRRGR